VKIFVRGKHASLLIRQRKIFDEFYNIDLKKRGDVDFYFLQLNSKVFELEDPTTPSREKKTSYIFKPLSVVKCDLIG